VCLRRDARRSSQTATEAAFTSFRDVIARRFDDDLATLNEVVSTRDGWELAADGRAQFEHVDTQHAVKTGRIVLRRVSVVRANMHLPGAQCANHASQFLLQTAS